jgi:hypothetical protein
MLIWLLNLFAAWRCLYWVEPVPYADGDVQASARSDKPEQLEYG